MSALETYGPGGGLAAAQDGAVVTAGSEEVRNGQAGGASCAGNWRG
jgi:hypothetical protein